MKYLTLAAALATVVIAPAFAQDTSSSMPMPQGAATGRPPMMSEHMQQHMEQLTPAQREEMQQRMAARKAKWDGMTPAQQKEIKDNFQKRLQERKAKWDAMTPAERDAKTADMKADMEKLKGMTPTERQAALQEMMKKGDVIGPAPADMVPASPPPPVTPVQ